MRQCTQANYLYHESNMKLEDWDFLQKFHNDIDSAIEQTAKEFGISCEDAIRLPRLKGYYPGIVGIEIVRFFPCANRSSQYITKTIWRKTLTKEKSHLIKFEITIEDSIHNFDHIRIIS